jgi:MFS transporter, DHA2 family, multidrug resistance protein
VNAVVARTAGRREWIGLGVIALPCLLYSMDLTVLNLAVPKLSVDLRPSSAQLLWIVDVYGFVLAGMLIPMGTLGDRIGRRRLLLIGAAAFGAASVLAAFSKSAAMLIVARAVLGIAGATLAPSTLSLIRSMFVNAQQRSFAIGVWITSYSVGGAIGPLVGGILLVHFWWGSVFLIGVPVMLVLLAVGPVLLPEFRDPNAGRMELLSATQSLTAVLLVIYGLKQIAQGNGGWVTAAAIAGGLSAGGLFVHRQRRLENPLIDLELFRVRAFGVALGSYTLGTFMAFGMFLFISQYLQLVHGLTALEAGIRMLPIFASFIVGSMLVPMLVRRVGPAALLGAGLTVAALGFALLATVQVNSDVALVVAACTAYSLGLAPVFTLATDTIVGAAPPERAGAASALSETGSELGGALGIAVLGSVGAAVYRVGMAPVGQGGAAQGAITVARGTIGGAIGVAGGLPSTAGAELVDAARVAFTRSMRVTSGISAIVAAITAVAVMVALRHVSRPVRDN